MKDWTGNKPTSFVILGASNHSEKEREENDFYATNPIAIDLLIKDGQAEINKKVWECACGKGHLAQKLIDYGFSVKSTDLIYRGFGVGGGRLLKYIRRMGRRYCYQPTL